MKKIIFVLLILVSAQAKFISGEGKFLARNGDSLSFVKKQLLSTAFKNIIDQELKRLGLDGRTFWSNYQAKYEEYFQKVKLALDEKYGLSDPEKELSADQKQKYEDELRYKRLLTKSQFGRLSRAIKSYSITKMSKSVRVPLSHYINISAHINEKELTDIYYKFIGVSSIRTFTKLFLDINLILTDTNWVELGVESENDFKNVLKKHWMEKLNAEVNSVFNQGIVFVDESTESKINERLKTLSQLSTMSKDQLYEMQDDDIQNALVLTINTRITKESFDTELKQLSLIFDGGLVLRDLKDGAIVVYQDFSREKSTFTVNDRHDLSSSIASLIYRLPISKIQRMRKYVEENVKARNTIDLVLRGAQSIKEVIKFSELLKENGVLYYFEPEIKTVSNDETLISLKYSGAKDKAIRVLGKLVAKPVDDNRIVARDRQLPFIFSIETSNNGGNNKEDKKL